MSDLFPGLSTRLGVQRRPDQDDELERAHRAELAGQARRDSQRGRSTDLSGFKERTALRESRERRQRADFGLIAKLLSGLVMGRLVGLDIGENAFANLYAGFATTLQALGLTVQPPSPSPNSANKAELAARGLGVSPEAAGRVQPATPRNRQKFDEFLAQTVGVPDLQAALDAGNADGLPAGLTESLSALLGALRAAVLADDGPALQRIGSDFGSLAAALHATTVGSTTQRKTKASGAPMVQIADGQWVDFELAERDPDTGQPRLKAGTVVSRKSGELRGRVTAIAVDGKFIPADDVDVTTGVPRRRKS